MSNYKQLTDSNCRFKADFNADPGFFITLDGCNSCDMYDRNKQTCRYNYANIAPEKFLFAGEK